MNSFEKDNFDMFIAGEIGIEIDKPENEEAFLKFIDGYGVRWNSGCRSIEYMPSWYGSEKYILTIEKNGKLLHCNEILVPCISFNRMMMTTKSLRRCICELRAKKLIESMYNEGFDLSDIKYFINSVCKLER